MGEPLSTDEEARGNTTQLEAGKASAAADQTRTEKPSRKGGAIRLRAINAILIFLAAAVALVFLYAVQQTNATYVALEEASERYIQCEQAASDLKAGSNYLTIQVRTFVGTQDREYLENYFWEVNENQRREHAVETVHDIQESESENLQKALDHSNELMGLECYAMRLVTEAKGYDDLTEKYLSDVKLSAADEALSPDEKLARASEIVYGDEYMGYVNTIESEIAKVKEDLIVDIDRVRDENQRELEGLLLGQEVLAIVLFLVFVAVSLVIIVLVLWPLRRYSESIRDNDPLPDTGARELRDMADAYNVMYEETMKNHEVLRRKAEHDHLTGLYNRSVFERLLKLHTNDHYALMLVDADYFKEINDTLGHDGGDAALQKIAGILDHAFRASDYPCRIGGDEFAVIMTEMTPELRHVVEAKIRGLQQSMLDTSDGLPPMTLSIGIAFNEGGCDGETMFKRADDALYDVKEAGRNGFAFYGG